MQRRARISRRTALRGLTAAGVSTIGPSLDALAQSAPAIAGKTKITVTGYYRTPAFHIAQRRGLFAKEGLEVEFYLVRLAPEHNKGLAEGRWPITLSSADTMLARTTQDGVDFLLFMEPEEGLDVQLIAQPKYKALSELRGKLFAADPALLRAADNGLKDTILFADEADAQAAGFHSRRAAAEPRPTRRAAGQPKT